MVTIPTVSISSKLQRFHFSIDSQKLKLLIETMSKDRPQRASQIVVLPGIATHSVWSRTVKIIPSDQLPVNGVKTGIVLGYFDPLRNEIRLFPETMLLVVRSKSNIHESVEQQFKQIFYPTLIEELEHGFQQASNKKYRSWLSWLHSQSTRFIPLFVIVASTYIELSSLSRWWHGVTFLIMMIWNFFPLVVSFIPKPKFIAKIQYRFSQREHDAKGIAISPKLYQLAHQALTIQFS